MGEANKKGKTREERAAAAKARGTALEKRKKQIEQTLKLYHAEVGLARLEYGLDLGTVTGTTERIVVVKFDELVALLEKLMPKDADPGPDGAWQFGPKHGDVPMDLTEQEIKDLGLAPPGTVFPTKEAAKAAAERYQFELDKKRARATVEATVEKQKEN